MRPGEVKSDKQAFHQILTRLEDDVGTILKLIPKGKEEGFFPDTAPFWALLRMTFPIAEAVGDLIYCNNSTAQNLQSVLENEFEAVRSGYRGKAVILTLLFRHSLAHTDELRTLIIGEREVGWWVSWSEEQMSHLSLLNDVPGVDVVIRFDTTAFYEDLVDVCHHAMDKTWGGQVMKRYNGWLTFDIDEASKRVKKSAIDELTKLLDIFFSEEFWQSATSTEVQAELANGADIQARDWEGATPLHKAASNGNPEAVIALVEAGANIKARTGGGLSEGETPLHKAAASNGNPEVVTVLVEAGADSEARDKESATPLHKAASYNGNPEVVTALVEAGANIEARNKEGKTSLHEAVWFNENPAVVKALLEAGADSEAQTKRGQTPLHMATGFRGDPAVAAALIEAGANVQARDKIGQTPLHEAAFRMPLAVVTALIEAGANVQAQDEGGGTPLHRAAHNENPAVVKVLVEAGANVQARNNVGSTPLHDVAAHNGNPVVVKVLLEAGADIEAQDEEGYTPLHAAAILNKTPTVVPALLDAGANPKAETNEGKTAFDLIQEDEKLKGTDAYWRLNDLQYD